MKSNDTYLDMAQEWGVDSKGNTRAGGFADLNNDGCWELIQVPLDGPVEIFLQNAQAIIGWIFPYIQMVFAAYRFNNSCFCRF